MDNCVDRKTEYKKSAVILLSVFFFVRAFLISPDTRTGIFINPIAITITTVNAVYILLSAIFSVLFSYTLLKAYESHNSLTAVPAVLIAADPVLPFMLQDCISLILGISVLVSVNVFAEKSNRIKTIAFAVFSAFAALLSPVSLFKFAPVLLLIFFFGSGRKSILPAVLSAASYALFSIVHGGLYEGNYSFKDFIYSYSFTENREFAQAAESLNPPAIASAATLVFSALIVYIFVKRFTALKKVEKKENLKDEITDAAIAVTAYILTLVGVFAYGITSSALTLTLITFIIMIKKNDRFACETAEKIRSFTDRNFFILVLLLAAMSVLMLNLKSPSGVYTSAATYFM